MVGRSLSATSEGIEQINRALTEKEWSREDLAQAAECSRQPAVKFCSGKTVSKKLFVSFCKLLNLDWEAIAGMESLQVATARLTSGIPEHFSLATLAQQIRQENNELDQLEQQQQVIKKQKISNEEEQKLKQLELEEKKLAKEVETKEHSIQLKVDRLVTCIRQKVRTDIHNRCGTIRVLDMEQPIGIDHIYTNVNILEKLPGRRRLGLMDLWQGLDVEDFDRFLLGQVQQERVPGLEAVQAHDKLMILGKPGAGKTTFMRRIATLCNQEAFMSSHLPVFVTLKEFAEAQGKPSLQEFITTQWHSYGLEDTKTTETVLKAGKGILLLDGLDEVLETEYNRVLQAIKSATQQFYQCKFIITCRIAAREYTFEQFTEVEAADFDQEQIKEFATKWFIAKEDLEKSERFIQRLQDNEPIQELATNPLLLTLLCLVFGDAADFPSDRAELYKEGLDILLKKWDAKRNIERDQVYKKLSLKRKEDLLSQLAFKMFEQGDYFFKQEVIEQQIIKYICNLPGASEDEETLHLDSEAVLKSIEAQHGLLVERARGIYSFSHLTFQEYFVAKQITSPTTQLHIKLEHLVTHFTEKRYREVIFLALGMLPEADVLLVLMKQRVDTLLALDLKLQEVLAWVFNKAAPLTISYKKLVVRASYFALIVDLDINLDIVLDSTLDFDRSLDFDLDFALTDAANVSLALYQALSHTPNLSRVYSSNNDLDLELALNLALNLALTLNLIYSLNLALSPTLAKNLTCDLVPKLSHALTRAIAIKLAPERCNASNSKLKLKLHDLTTALKAAKGWKQFHEWWQDHGQRWTNDLRTAMIEHRNIGHNWQLAQKQKEKLRHYYDANLLLVECLNSGCYVTKATRQEIEETLLLPMAEIERRRGDGVMG